MNAYRSVGYKSPLIKGIFLFFSILLLVSVNFFLFRFSFVRFILFAISGLVRRSMMRVLTRLYYSFEEDEIAPYLPNKKKVSLKKNEIGSIAKYVGYIPKWRGIGVYREGTITFCVSSFEKLLEVRMSDGQIYVISPRKQEEWLYNYYGSM